MTHRHIRQAIESDRDRLYEICLLTAAAGNDGTYLYSDPKGPGYLHAVPYLLLEPDYAFVLDDGDGTAIGYVVATPDSASFENRLQREWWPWVRQQIAGMPVSRQKDQTVIDHAMGTKRKDPRILEEHPAHLHINLLPPAQSGGWGRKMIEKQLSLMKSHEVRGLHLGVDPANTRAAAFYQHLGFQDISREGQLIYGIRLNRRGRHSERHGIRS